MARPFTAIDMALCRLHLDAILAAFAHAIGANLGRPLTKGLAIRDLRQNLAQLRLAPDYIDVMVFGMDLSLGEAGRRGRFALILPLSALDVIRASIQAHNVGRARDRPNDLWKTLMRRAAASAPVRVDAVLHRQRLSLAALQALHVGQVLEIPRQSVEQVRSRFPSPAAGPRCSRQGRLGAYQDQKVIKLADARPTAGWSPTSTARLRPAPAAMPDSPGDAPRRPPSAARWRSPPTIELSGLGGAAGLDHARARQWRCSAIGAGKARSERAREAALASRPGRGSRSIRAPGRLPRRERPPVVVEVAEHRRQPRRHRSATRRRPAVRCQLGQRPGSQNGKRLASRRGRRRRDRAAAAAVQKAAHELDPAPRIVPDGKPTAPAGAPRRRSRERPRPDGHEVQHQRRERRRRGRPAERQRRRVADDEARAAGRQPAAGAGDEAVGRVDAEHARGPRRARIASVSAPAPQPTSSHSRPPAAASRSRNSGAIAGASGP